MRRWASAAMFVIGCGHAAPAPRTELGSTHATADAGVAIDAGPLALEDDPPRLADRSLKMYQDLAAVLAEVKADCGAGGTKLEALAVTDAEVITAIHHVLHAGHDKIKRLKAAIEPHQAEFDAAAQAIAQSPTMRTCAADAKFAHAIDALAGEGS